MVEIVNLSLETSAMGTVDVNSVIVIGENSVIRTKQERQRRLHHTRKLLAHPDLFGGARPCPLSKERDYGRPVADLFGQHSNGALAAIHRSRRNLFGVT